MSDLHAMEGRPAATHRVVVRRSPKQQSMLSDDAMLTSLRQDVIGRDVYFPTPFGERLMVYADYVASGRGLAQVERALQAVLRTYANTHTQSSYSGAQTTKYREEARSMVLSSVGGNPAKDAVIFCGSGSSAAIDKLQRVLQLTVPHSLAAQCRAMKKGNGRPVVFVGGAEHHSNLLSWRESVCEVVEVPIDGVSGKVDLASLERSLELYRHRKIKLGSFSACSNVTGIIFQTEAITRLLHEHGALSFWDYAGGGAYLPIRMTDPADPARNPDAVFLSPHKFIGGAGGTPGVLVAKRAVLEGGTNGDKPTFAGGGTVTFVSSEGHSYADDVVEREEGGTPAVAACIRCGLVFRLKDQISTSLIHQREQAMVRRARDVWGSHPSILLLGGWAAERLAIFSFLIRPPGVRGSQWLHYNLVSVVLNDLFGIQSRGGCSCAGPYGLRLLDIDRHERERLMQALLNEGKEHERPGWTRLNLHFFLSDEEVDYILQAVSLVAEHGHKLLPYYKREATCGMWRHMNFNAKGHLASLADFQVLKVDPLMHDGNSNMEMKVGSASSLSGSSGMSEKDRHAVLRRQLRDGETILRSLKDVDLAGHPSLFRFGGENLAASMDLAAPLPLKLSNTFVDVNIKVTGGGPEQGQPSGDHSLKAHKAHRVGQLTLPQWAEQRGRPSVLPGQGNADCIAAAKTANKANDTSMGPARQGRRGRLIRALCRPPSDDAVFLPVRVPRTSHTE